MNGFGLDHLPYGVFSVAGGPRRVGVRYDDEEGAWVVDLHGETGRPEFAEPSLNALMALGPEVWRQTREEVRALIEGGCEPLPLEEVDAAPAVRGRRTTSTSTPRSTTPPTSAGSSGPTPSR